MVLARQGRSVVLEPCAPNIVRIPSSSEKTAALAAAGYGFMGTPSSGGWAHERDSGGSDVLGSGRMVSRASDLHA